MTSILVTFVGTTFLYVCLFLIVCRRIAKHLQGNPEAVKAVLDHVFLPAFGKKSEHKPVGQKTEQKVMMQKTKGPLV